MTQRAYGYGEISDYPQPAATAMPRAVGWTVVAWIFFFPLGVAALLNHVAIAPAWYAGDRVGAQVFALKARRFGIIALCVGLAIVVLYILLVVVLVATTSSAVNDCVPSSTC